MSKSIFISCVHEDSCYISNIEKWSREKLLGDVAITHEVEDLRPHGRGAIVESIENKIKGSACILVLIGDTTHNHEWIELEVELARKYHKEIICMRIPLSKGGPPPLLLNSKKIAFNPNSLKKLIDSK